MRKHKASFSGENRFYKVQLQLIAYTAARKSADIKVYCADNRLVLSQGKLINYLCSCVAFEKINQ